MTTGSNKPNEWIEQMAQYVRTAESAAPQVGAADLPARLRSNRPMPYSILSEAADRIESQAKRIAELEAKYEPK